MKSDPSLCREQNVEFSTEEKIQTAIDFAPRMFLICAVSYVVQTVKQTLLTVKWSLIVIPLLLLIDWVFDLTGSVLG